MNEQDSQIKQLREINKITSLNNGLFPVFSEMTDEEKKGYDDFVKAEENKARVSAEKTAERKRIEYYQSEQSGVNKKFWDKSSNDYIVHNNNEQHIKFIVLDFIEDVKKGNCNRILMFYGSCGLGKTLLGSSVIRECGGFYTTSYLMCTEFDSCSDFKAKRNKIEFINFLISVPVLIIDEYGTGTKSEADLIPNVLNMRYENELPSVIIGNDKKETIVLSLGKRTFDRLNEVCTSIEFTGESYRKELRSVKNENYKI